MKIATKHSQLADNGYYIKVRAATAPLASKVNFKSFYDSIVQKQSGLSLSPDIPMLEISKIRHALENAKHINPKDILFYQIRISELNLRVELISKAADSAVAPARKLQNAQ